MSCLARGNFAGPFSEIGGLSTLGMVQSLLHLRIDGDLQGPGQAFCLLCHIAKSHFRFVVGFLFPPACSISLL